MTVVAQAHIMLHSRKSYEKMRDLLKATTEVTLESKPLTIKVPHLLNATPTIGIGTQFLSKQRMAILSHPSDGDIAACRHPESLSQSIALPNLENSSTFHDQGGDAAPHGGAVH